MKKSLLILSLIAITLGTSVANASSSSDLTFDFANATVTGASINFSALSFSNKGSVAWADNYSTTAESFTVSMGGVSATVGIAGQAVEQHYSGTFAQAYTDFYVYGGNITLNKNEVLEVTIPYAYRTTATGTDHAEASGRIGATFFGENSSKSASDSFSSMHTNENGSGVLNFLLKNSSNQVGTVSFWLSGHTFVSAVPEPESYTMMLAGLGLLAFMAHREKLPISISLKG